MHAESPHDLKARPRSYAGGDISPPLLEVLHDFDVERISCCYWKSSRRIKAAFAGEGDIDLLIAREDQHRAQAILLDRGFKLFPSTANNDHPALASYLGYDDAAGSLIHVHLHFRLVIGEPLLKNYRLPWEDVILARAVRHPTLPIRMLDLDCEAVLLMVRSCLELRRQDPIAIRDWRAITGKFALDRRDLVARVDRASLTKLAAELLDTELAALLVDAFYDRRPLERQARLRHRMRRHLAPHRAYNAFEARARSLGRAMASGAGYLNRRLFHAPRPWNRRAPGGGLVVAMVGIDGSGKSTAVAMAKDWLAAKIDTVPIYFGTGDGRPSLLLRPLKLVAPLAKRFVGTKEPSRSVIAAGSAGRLYSVLLMIWSVAVALERRKKLTAARRGASRGIVVLGDRFPQNEILRFNDGPLLTRMALAPRWLRRFEADAYALSHRLRPDLVIKLVVTPETAARREPTMVPAVIRERIGALQELRFPGARVVTIDAEQPLPEMFRAIKREIWRQL